jgi:bacillithiol system protein YtxJ
MLEDLRELREERTLDEVKESDVAILYKHSTRCPTSWSAKREVERFLERSSGTPVYIVDVVKDRSLSRWIAEVLDVRHESPQAILLRSGQVITHVSHRQITEKLLQEWVGQAKV